MRYLIAASVLGLTGSTTADIWTVDDDGPADFDNIQAAVDAASNGDEIVVEPGTYTSEENSYVVDMDGKSITLRSSGTAEATIIDAQGTGWGVDCRDGVSPDGVIDGFTITGSADWGINCEFSSPTIRGCTITDNQGGVYFSESAEGEPTITDCLIVGNTATSLGGGICCSYSTSPTISNCTITGNSAGNTKITMGGGIYCGGGCSPTISNCLIEENEAVIGGGIACWYEGDVISISGCSIVNNTATCGVIWQAAPELCGGGIYSFQHNVAMTSSSVCGNSPNQIDISSSLNVLIDNGDNVIRFGHADLEYVLETWGTLWSSPGDVNYDGSVNIVDLLMVLSNWGPCP